MVKKKNKSKRRVIPFDKALSIELDKATIAFEQAKERGDAVRMLYAANWKSEIEKKLFGVKKGL